MYYLLCPIQRFNKKCMSSLIKYGNSLLKPFPNIDSETLNEICNKCKFDVNHVLSLTKYMFIW